jgi:membrane associated rhomboid family serine protease
MDINLFLIVVTVAVSLLAFNNAQLMHKLILYPAIMRRPEEYYRLVTSGFIHANIPHLAFNMLCLYSFGEAVQMMGFSHEYFPLYITGIIVASLPSFLRNRNNPNYLSLGASGGVAAVMFFCIYFQPWSKIGFMFIPVGIPSILFAVLYLAYSAYMDKTGHGGINHNAHFTGSLYGLLFAFLADPTHGAYFLYTITHPAF